MIRNPSFPMLACLLVAAGTAAAGPVNINTADAATLARELDGIGPARAAAIVEYRQRHGVFRSVDELAQIKGISQKLIDSNRADLRLGSGNAVAAPPAKPAAAPASGTARK